MSPLAAIPPASLSEIAHPATKYGLKAAACITELPFVRGR